MAHLFVNLSHTLDWTIVAPLQFPGTSCSSSRVSWYPAPWTLCHSECMLSVLLASLQNNYTSLVVAQNELEPSEIQVWTKYRYRLSLYNTAGGCRKWRGLQKVIAGSDSDSGLRNNMIMHTNNNTYRQNRTSHGWDNYECLKRYLWRHLLRHLTSVVSRHHYNGCLLFSDTPLRKGITPVQVGTLVVCFDNQELEFILLTHVISCVHRPVYI